MLSYAHSMATVSKFLLWARSRFLGNCSVCMFGIKSGSAVANEVPSALPNLAINYGSTDEISRLRGKHDTILFVSSSRFNRARNSRRSRSRTFRLINEFYLRTAPTVWYRRDVIGAWGISSKLVYGVSLC